MLPMEALICAAVLAALRGSKIEHVQLVSDVRVAVASASRSRGLTRTLRGADDGLGNVELGTRRVTAWCAVGRE